MSGDRDIANFLQNPLLVAVIGLLSAASVGGHVIGISNKDPADIQVAVEVAVDTALRRHSERHDESRTSFVHRVDTEHESCLLNSMDAGVTRTDAELVCGIRKMNEVVIRLIE